MVQLPAEVVTLLEAAAQHPDGPAALFEGHLESVAALYQVHPAALELLRACIVQPGVKARALEVLARAPDRVVVPLEVAVRPPNRDALIEKATALPNGLELLTRGPIETAAMQLGAHPFVVDEARLHLARGAAA